MSHIEPVYACTLTEGQAAERIDTDRALAERVVHTERLEDGVRVVFTGPGDTRRLIDTFVANERRCCGFFTFRVDESHETVSLVITAPATDSAQRLVDAAKQTFDLGPGAVGGPFDAGGAR